MLKDFKEFALKGSVIDMGVGVIIGASFGKIVTSFVSDVLMPPLGLILGRVDFSSLFVSLSGQHYDSLAAAKAAGAPTLNYGLFVNNIIDFVLVALALFLMIRWVNRIKKPTVLVKECPECLSSIPVLAKRCAHCGSVVAMPT